ncbi:MAG: MBL fold metallo-hydrolase, partial [Clostridiales bacterium]|nr:MBL fold metallo-hydrolase [Clostridiales bacterium]
MKVTFIGATHEVTGSCTLLEVNGKNILIDCGMEQGVDLFENIQIPVEPEEIDMIVVTHAHIDHSGKIPFLVAHGYTGPIYSTEATKQLCDIMLLDSAHIQEFEAKWRNRKGKRAGREDYIPLYTTIDAQNTLKLFKTAGYGKDIEIADGITINYTDAGHLLGSSNVLFKLKEEDVERTILFSGDVGNINKPLIRSPQPPPNADYVVCESTYGDRLHDDKPDYVGELTEIIQRTLDRGGNVVIPAFAIGRTQELLYYIRVIKEQNLVKNHAHFPVVLDSPLAVEATNIYSSGMEEYYNEEALDLARKGINPISFPDLEVSISTDESRAINLDTTPKIIISAAGMCEA